MVQAEWQRAPWRRRTLGAGKGYDTFDFVTLMRELGTTSEETQLSWLDRTLIEDLPPDGRAIHFHEAGMGGELGGPHGWAFMRRTDRSTAPDSPSSIWSMD